MADLGFMFLLIPEHNRVVTQLHPDPVPRSWLPPSPSPGSDPKGPQGVGRGGRGYWRVHAWLKSSSPLRQNLRGGSPNQGFKKHS